MTAVADGAARITASADSVSGVATVTVLISARPVALPALPEVGQSKIIAQGAFYRVVRRRLQLTPAVRTDLDRYAIAIQASPNAKWELAGYTDILGSRAVNLRLSRERAQLVKDYLVSKGVSASSLTVVGMGPVNPVASNRTVRGRAQNRRVELKRLQ